MIKVDLEKEGSRI